MTICNARIIATDDTIGNSNALSCDEPSSMFSTDAEMVLTLSCKSLFALSIFELAESNVMPNCEVSVFNLSSSFAVSSKTSLSSKICSDIPLMSCVRICVTALPCDMFP